MKQKEKEDNENCSLLGDYQNCLELVNYYRLEVIQLSRRLSANPSLQYTRCPIGGGKVS